MKWNIGFNRLLLAVILLVGLVGTGQAEVPASFRTAVVRVDGMVCYFCSMGIEKKCKLKHLGKGYSTDLAKGLFKIQMDPSEKVPPPDHFAEIVKGAGYTYRGVQLELEGKIVASNKKNIYGLLLPDTGQIIPFKASAAQSSRLTPLLHRTTHVQLLANADTSQGWQLDKFIH